MTNYLSPILRDQFNKFYRYGYTFIPASQVMTFDGNISDEVKTKLIDLFNNISPFEYDEDYLILHLDKSENETSSNIRFDIQNIISVYPLSMQAKVSVENKIDQRIKLEQPIFETALTTIEANIHKQEIEKAIDALWLICNLEGSSTALSQAIGLENIFQGIEFRKSGTKANKIKVGSYWSYLLAYDRFDYFPNSTLGFFYDAGQVFAYSKKHPTFEGSGLHKFLHKINSENPDIKFKEVISTLESEEQIKGYISQTTDNNIKQYFVAPLYLMLKDELRNSEEVSQTKLIKNLKHLLDFGDNFKAAVILLGAFFGYKKFYDNYYDKLDLRFYKPVKKEAAPQNKVEEVKPKQEPVIETPKEKIEVTILVANEPVVEIKKDEKKAVSQTVDDYQQIILTTLNTKGACKLSELATEIKSQTGKKSITNQIVKNVLKEMEGVEIFKDKQTEKVKFKSSSVSNKSLFDS